MERLETFHIVAFIIPVNLENSEWCLLAVMSLMAYQSIWYDNMTYGTEAVDAIYKNFYVEDMLKSVASVPKAIHW